MLLELQLLLGGGLPLIQTLSCMDDRLSTTLAGLVVVSGGLLMLCWLSARCWPCHYWCITTTEQSMQWITARSWCAATA